MNTPADADAPDLRHLASPALRDFVRLATAPDAAQHLARIDRLAGCTRPIRLHPQHTPNSADSTSGHDSSATSPPDRLLIACGNRRVTRCPTCSAVYAADTYHLIHAGLAGGKTVPDTVADHPRLFVTLIAPSFGPVHHQTGPGRPCRCQAVHGDDDPLLGTPLDPDRYDYTGAVLFNAHAGQLWSAFTTRLRRTLAHTAQVPVSRLRDHLTLSFAKVAEYQKRGAVHFHAVLRLDGPQGPGSTPPVWATAPMLADAVRAAVARTTLTTSGGHTPYVVRFGVQLDIQDITTDPIGSGEHGHGPLSSVSVAAYIAKYATKTADHAGALDTPLHCPPCHGTGLRPGPPLTPRRCARCHGSGLTRPIDDLPVDAHTHRLVRTCRHLAHAPAVVRLKLWRWTHTLGYRGHFTTKSRTYSTTLTALRDARHHWRQDQPPPGDAPGAPERPATNWTFTGSGYTPGEHLLAAHTRHHRAHARQPRHEGEPRP